MNGSTKLAIKMLAAVVLSAIGVIGLISLVGALVRGGVLGDTDAEVFAAGDEALSILGNIGSAAIGGLVGWLSRDLIVKRGEEVVEDAGVAPLAEEVEEDEVWSPEGDLEDEVWADDEEYPDPLIQADPEEAELPAEENRAGQ